MSTRLALLFALLSLPVFAQNEAKLPGEQQKLYEDILDSLINPCPAENSTVLHSNPTCEYANKVRAEVRGMVVAGKGKQEIIEAMVAEYAGQKDIRALPSTGGFGLAAWIAPACALAIAAAFIVLRMRAWQHGSVHEHAPALAADAVHRRIEEELAELRNP